MEFHDLIEKRRSIRKLERKSLISDDKLKELVTGVLKHSPTAFHSQGGVVVLLLEEAHDRLWQSLEDRLKQKLSSERFIDTQRKIEGFQRGYGTILFFEDQEILENLKEKFPKNAQKFEIWAEQSQGMLQYAMWMMLSEQGFGASLQHYNELLEEDISYLPIQKSWKLIAQMPFGIPAEEPNEKEFRDLENRCLVVR